MWCWVTSVDLRQILHYRCWQRQVLQYERSQRTTWFSVIGADWEWSWIPAYLVVLGTGVGWDRSRSMSGTSISRDAELPMLIDTGPAVWVVLEYIYIYVWHGDELPPSHIMSSSYLWIVQGTSMDGRLRVAHTGPCDIDPLHSVVDGSLPVTCLLAKVFLPLCHLLPQLCGLVSTLISSHLI